MPSILIIISPFPIEVEIGYLKFKSSVSVSPRDRFTQIYLRVSCLCLFVCNVAFDFGRLEWKKFRFCFVHLLLQNFIEYVYEL